MKQINTSFLIEFISNLPSLARTGKLVSGKSTLETPCCLLTTKGGSIPHLSKEVLGYVLKDQIVNQILQISLTNTIHMEEALKSTNTGIASFVGYKEFSTFITLNDPCEVTPSGFNDKDIVPVFTRRGKEVVSVEKYMQIISAMQPDIYQVLCDSDTNNESSKKRIQKSLDRSITFLKSCLDIHKNSPALSNSMILVPIVGGYNKNARSYSIKASKEYLSQFGGYTLDGFHNNGSSALKIKPELVKDIVLHCVKELSNEKIRFMQGAYDPLTTLELINLGIDVFDISYVYIATQNNKALCFDFDLTDNVKNGLFEIDLNEEKHKEEFIPLRYDCNCVTCKQHTRAYVHHLIKTRELLGPILLMVHNLHYYLQFFESIRSAIKNNNLSQIIELLKNQIPPNSIEKIQKEE